MRKVSRTSHCKMRLKIKTRMSSCMNLSVHMQVPMKLLPVAGPKLGLCITCCNCFLFWHFLIYFSATWSFLKQKPGPVNVLQGKEGKTGEKAEAKKDRFVADCSLTIFRSHFFWCSLCPRTISETCFFTSVQPHSISFSEQLQWLEGHRSTSSGKGAN